MNIDRVERAADARQQMARRDHRRMHPRLDRAVVIFGDRQQLDRVAEFARIGDIGLRNPADALGMHLRRLAAVTPNASVTSRQSLCAAS